MRKPRQILLCVFVFIKNTSNYKIKVKQMIFYARSPRLFILLKKGNTTFINKIQK